MPTQCLKQSSTHSPSSPTAACPSSTTSCCSMACRTSFALLHSSSCCTLRVFPARTPSALNSFSLLSVDALLLFAFTSVAALPCAFVLLCVALCSLLSLHLSFVVNIGKSLSVLYSVLRLRACSSCVRGRFLIPSIVVPAAAACVVHSQAKGRRRCPP